jgi:hypothetical protein
MPSLVSRLRNVRGAVSLALLVSLSVWGCFKDPKVDVTQPRACKSDKSCPWGYVCGANGFCCASSNGKSCDVVGPVGRLDASTMDSSVDSLRGEVAADALSGDASIDTASVIDEAGGVGSGGIGDVPGAGGQGGTIVIDASEQDVPMDMAVSGADSGAGGIGGTGGGGSGGASSGGQGGATCTGTTKLCNGTCIATTSCCGGCTGGTPVCSNGTCVAKTIGDACSTSTECGTGVCADGVCCNVACVGQCESCATANSKGTCTPVTTPRTACAGSGVCAGVCDGSTQNRKACVYPDDKTSCGAGASCASGKLATAAVCNGAGTCNGSTITPCTYGCRTDAAVACATSCPSGQGLCGGSCVDILSTASHCGGTCTACIGPKPQCNSGTCVQCVFASDCSSFGTGAVCTADHTCLCLPPSAENILRNPGFDQSLTGWTATPGATFDSVDAGNCSASGSARTEPTADLRIGTISQCAVAQPSTKYYFGFDYMQGQADNIDCTVSFYVGSTCSGGALTDTLTLSGGSAPVTSWLLNWSVITSPSLAGSAMVFCQSHGAQPGWFDQMFLSTANGF